MKSYLFGWKAVFRYLLVLSILLGAKLYGDTYTVSNEGELSTVIGEVNNSTEDDTITFIADIVLNSALPVIEKVTGNLTIEGNGFTLSRNTDASTGFRVLYIDEGGVTIDVPIEVTIDRLTISGGNCDGYGGGIENLSGGTVTLTNCTVSGNMAGVGGGGGIVNGRGALTLTNCTVSGNEASDGAYGGGILNSGTLTLTNCTVSNNTASAYSGGGIVNSGGTVTLTDCTVSGNTASAFAFACTGDGGGISNWDGTVTLTNCTVSGNEAADNGGGIHNLSGGTVTLTDCTVSGNMAGSDYDSGYDSERGSGGGIYNSSGGTVTLTNCTVSGNEATGNEATGDVGFGGGIRNSGTLTLIRNIVAWNIAESGSEISSDGGTIDADEDNVFGHSGLTTAQAFDAFVSGATDVTCTSDGTIPTVIASILNTTLGNNGEPTLTHALVAGSPAIDIASTGPATDQRGVARPQGSGVDAGAYEYASDPSMSVSLATLDVVAAGESHALTVISNVVWTATTTADWLTITPISGIGNGSVNVTASANTGVARNGIITLSATGVSPVTVTVTQAAAPNTAPRFRIIGNKTVKAGQSITFQVIADDEDDNVLQYSATHP